MLGFLFGFNARLGRLNYFLSTIALAGVMTALCYAVASYVYQASPRILQEPAVMMTWPVIAAGIGFLWATFMLQSMRIRDIGWDPVCVIPAWIAILIIDKLVADKIPAWSLDRDHNGTVVGGLLNFGLILALTFWPGGESEDASLDDSRPKSAYARPRSDAAPVASDRIARATGAEAGRRAY